MNKENNMLVFDLDNTLLKGRFIDTCAARFNFSQALTLLRQIDKNPISLTVRIASFFRSKTKTELLEIADQIPLVEDALDVIKELKQRGYKVGIISDSYQVVTQFIAGKLDVDFSYSNELQFEGEECTGEVLIPSWFHFSEKSLCRHQICKTNAILHACGRFNAKLDQCTVIGDSANDLCLVKNAGMSFALGEDAELAEVATKQITRGSFSELLNYAH